MENPADSPLHIESDPATSATPFLARGSGEYSFDKEATGGIPKAKSWLHHNIKFVIFHLVMMGTYAMLFGFGFRNCFARECLPQNNIYTPARNALEYEVKGMQATISHPTKYMGSTDSADQAWRDLMRHSSIRLDDDDLKAINRSSIHLGDGGYLGTPTVYHELHCLKMIRWAVNLERYSHEFSENILSNLPHHLEHCIDVLRQSVICRGDTSLITFTWEDDTPLPQTDFQTDHQCVNWEKLENWVIERSVDVFAPGVLNHPIYGPTFPNGYENKD